MPTWTTSGSASTTWVEAGWTNMTTNITTSYSVPPMVFGNTWTAAMTVIPQAPWDNYLAPSPPPPAPPRLNVAIQQRRATEEAAQKRAEATLLSLLSPAERERYRTDRQFEVQGSAGGRYLIRHGYQQNVFQLRGEPDSGGYVDVFGRRDRLCAHPHMWEDSHRRLPVEDAMVAQLLALRFDEPAFLQIANRG